MKNFQKIFHSFFYCLVLFLLGSVLSQTLSRTTARNLLLVRQATTTPRRLFFNFFTTTTRTTPRRPATTATTTRSPPTTKSGVDFVESNDTAVENMIATFDCRRQGHDCSLLGGACNLDTGLCECLENYTAFDCSYQLSQLVNLSLCNQGKGCGLADDDESVCIESDDSDDKRCHCSYSTYGAACDRQRYELRCSEAFLTLRITPYSSSGRFVGQIFVIDSASNVRSSSRDCRFSNVTSVNSSNETTFQLQLSYKDLVQKCGGVSSVSNDSHELKVVVQSDGEWLTTFDEIITAKCSFRTAKEYLKSIVVDAGAGTNFGDPAIDNAAVHISNELTNIAANEIRAERRRTELTAVVPQPLLSLGWPSTKQPIRGPVKLGDTILVQIDNTANDSFYSAIRAEDCTLSMDDAMDAKLIANACPASRFAWSLLQWSRTVTSNSSVAFLLRLPANAQQSPSSSVAVAKPRQLTITCRVKLCSADVAADECSFEPCNNKTAGLQRFLASQLDVPSYGRRRRRRQAGDDIVINNDEEVTAGDILSEEDDILSTVFAMVKTSIAISYEDDDYQQTGNRAKNVKNSQFAELDENSNAMADCAANFRFYYGQFFVSIFYVFLHFIRN